MSDYSYRYAIRTEKDVKFLHSGQVGILDVIPSAGMFAITKEERIKLTNFLKILLPKQDLPNDIISIVPIKQPKGNY